MERTSSKIKVNSGVNRKGVEEKSLFRCNEGQGGVKGVEEIIRKLSGRVIVPTL